MEEVALILIVRIVFEGVALALPFIVLFIVEVDANWNSLANRLSHDAKTNPLKIPRSLRRRHPEGDVQFLKNHSRRTMEELVPWVTNTRRNS